MYNSLSVNTIYNPDQTSKFPNKEQIKQSGIEEDWSYNAPLFVPSVEHCLGSVAPFKHSTIQDTQHKPRMLKNKPTVKKQDSVIPQMNGKTPHKRAKPDVADPPKSTVVKIDIKKLLGVDK